MGVEVSSSVNHHLLRPQLCLNLFPAARRRQRAGNDFTGEAYTRASQGGNVSPATLSLLVVIILFISLRSQWLPN